MEHPPVHSLRIAELPLSTRTRAEKLAAFIREEFRALEIPLGGTAEDAEALKKLAMDPSISDERLETLEEATATLAKMLQGRSADLLSVEDARAFLSEMLEMLRASRFSGESRVRAQVAIALAQADAGVDPAETLQVAMDTVLGMPTGSSPTRALGYIAAAWAAVGNLSKALELASREQGDAHREMIRQIVVAEAKAGRLPSAITLAQSIDGDGYRGRVLSEVAMARSRAGDAEGAARAAEAIPGPAQRDRDQAEFHVAIAVARDGDIPSALAKVRKLQDDGIRGEALAKMAGMYASAGDISTATALVDEIPMKTYRSFAWMEIAVAEARSGDIAAARKTAGLIEADWKLASTLTMIARVCVELGREEEALDIVEQYPSGLETWQRCQTSAEIAIATAESGKIARALEHASAIPESGSRAKALAGIAVAVRDAGGDPAEMYAKALVLARNSGWLWAQAVRNVARIQLRAGDHAAALRTARELADEHGGAVLLEEIAEDLLKRLSTKQPA